MTDFMTDSEDENTTPTSPTNKDTTPLSEQDVINWLRQHPDFLTRNPDLCDFLLPPEERKGKGVADFQHYMIKRLREDRDGVIEEAREIVETSRANMNNQSRLFRTVLLLLDARSFDEFIKTITMDMPSLLDVDIITLLVESDDDVIPHVNLSGVRAIPAGTADKIMGDNRVMLSANITGEDLFYGGGAGLVKSQVLLKIKIAPNLPSAMVAFGSRDPNQFQPGQGTELIAFLGHVIERYMRIWLNV